MQIYDHELSVEKQHSDSEYIHLNLRVSSLKACNGIQRVLIIFQPTVKSFLNLSIISTMT